MGQFCHLPSACWGLGVTAPPPGVLPDFSLFHQLSTGSLAGPGGVCVAQGSRGLQGCTPEVPSAQPQLRLPCRDAILGRVQEQVTGKLVEGTALCTSLSLAQHPGQPQTLTGVGDECRGPEEQLWGTELDTAPRCHPSAHRQDPGPPLFVVLFLKLQRRTPTSVCWKRGVSPAAKSSAHSQTCRS